MTDVNVQLMQQGAGVSLSLFPDERKTGISPQKMLCLHIFLKPAMVSYHVTVPADNYRVRLSVETVFFAFVQTSCPCSVNTKH